MGTDYVSKYASADIVDSKEEESESESGSDGSFSDDDAADLEL